MNTLRRGIRHLHDVTSTELNNWCGSSGQLDCTVTEKTDGMAFAFGWDSERECFYSRTAHSPRTYDPIEYRVRALDRFGSKHNPTISASFIEAHLRLASSEGLKGYVRDHQTEVVGEIFLRSLAEVKGDQVKFVGTWYDGVIIRDALFVVHSMCNKYVLTNVGMWSNDEIHFDHDLVKQPPIAPPVKDQDRDYVQGAIEAWLDLIPRKWGEQCEGHVLHKAGYDPIKVMQASFYTQKRKF